MTVLYIDDDPDDQEIFREALTKISPHSILYTAEGGLEALAMLDSIENKLDYIFLDVNMPVMNGKQFLRQFTLRHGSAKPPVVAYTTSSNGKDAEELLKLGAVQVVSKHATFSEVCKKLKEFI